MRRDGRRAGVPQCAPPALGPLRPRRSRCARCACAAWRVLHQLRVAVRHNARRGHCNRRDAAGGLAGQSRRRHAGAVLAGPSALRQVCCGGDAHPAGGLRYDGCVPHGQLQLRRLGPRRRAVAGRAARGARRGQAGVRGCGRCATISDHGRPLEGGVPRGWRTGLARKRIAARWQGLWWWASEERSRPAARPSSSWTTGARAVGSHAKLVRGAEGQKDGCGGGASDGSLRALVR